MINCLFPCINTMRYKDTRAHVLVPCVTTIYRAHGTRKTSFRRVRALNYTETAYLSVVTSVLGGLHVINTGNKLVGWSWRICLQPSVRPRDSLLLLLVCRLESVVVVSSCPSREACALIHFQPTNNNHQTKERHRECNRAKSSKLTL